MRCHLHDNLTPVARDRRLALAGCAHGSQPRRGRRQLAHHVAEHACRRAGLCYRKRTQHRRSLDNEHNVLQARGARGGKCRFEQFCHVCQT
jgi:hypothetical protein